MEKLKRPYWNIEKEFDFYFEENKNKKISDIALEFGFKKYKNKIYIIENKKVLFLDIVTFGLGKNGKISKNLRACIPGNSYYKEIDFVLCYHQNTKLFLLFDNSRNTIITNVKNMSSLSIQFWIFFYFKKFGNFKNEYITKKRKNILWIFKKKETLFEILNNKNYKINETIEENKKNIKNFINNKLKILSTSEEHKNFLIELEEIYTTKNGTYKTNKINKIKTRMNQVYWRQKLLLKYNNKCFLTLYDSTIPLEACHIKPYRDLEKNEIKDLKNGIIMSPTLHKLFDNGFFSFDDNYKIVYSEYLKEDNKKNLENSIKNIENYSKILKKNVDKKYLKYHHDNIFKKNKFNLN